MTARGRSSARTVASVPSPSGPYSHSVAVGDLVLTSGMSPHDPVTGALPEGVAAQTEAVLDHLAAVLAEEGLDLDDVVRVTAHLAELSDFAAYNEVMAQRFAQPYPVRTTVGSQLPGFLVELDVIAVRPAGEKENP